MQKIKIQQDIEYFEGWSDRNGYWLVTGSVAKSGRICKKSDIDLICITRHTVYIYTESCYINGILYQIVFMPFYKLSDILAKDIMSMGKIYVNMIENAIPLFPGKPPWLSSLKAYISKMKSIMHITEDEHITYSTDRILELCRELKDDRNDRMIIAADLFNVMLRFAANCPNASSKHLGRKIKDNPIALKIRQSYEDTVISHDYKTLLTSAKELIQPFITKACNTTTGISFNIPTGDSVILYIPIRNMRQESFRNILTELERHCGKHRHYTFYISYNQALECGTYLYIDTMNSDSSRLIESLFRCHKELMQICIKQDIKVIFPYHTAFDTGYYFGGKIIFRSLVRSFCKLSDFISKIADKDTLVYGICLCRQFDKGIANGKQLLTGYMESITLDAVDPNGIYNIRQAQYACKEWERHYDICGNRCAKKMLPHDTGFDTIINETTEYIKSINEKDIVFPDITYIGYKKDYLTKNIMDHMFSTLCLGQQEKYAAVYYYLNSCK